MKGSKKSITLKLEAHNFNVNREHKFMSNDEYKQNDVFWKCVTYALWRGQRGIKSASERQYCVTQRSQSNIT